MKTPRLPVAALLVLNLSTLASFAGDTAASPVSGASGKPDSAKTTVEFSTGYTGNIDFTHDGKSAGGASVVNSSVEASVPLPPAPGGLFPKIGLSYDSFLLDRDPKTPLPGQFHSIRLTLSAFAPINDQWSTILAIAPGLSNTGPDFTADGFGVSGFALLNYKYSEVLTFSLGLAGNSFSEGFGRISPLGGVEWRIAPDWTANIGFPRTNLTYQATPKLKLHTGLRANTGSFYVESDPLPKGLKKPSLDDSKLNYLSVRVAAGADYEICTGATIGLSVGWVVVQRTEYKSPDYELEQDGGAPFVGASVKLAF